MSEFASWVARPWAAAAVCSSDTALEGVATRRWKELRKSVEQGVPKES
jgi:hypothetical protein